MAKFVRCSACPRCGSSSFKKVRPEVVFSLRRVRECRRCAQQYRAPASIGVCLFLLLVAAGLCVPLGMQVAKHGLEPFYLVRPIQWPIMAGAGALIFLWTLVMLLRRGIKPPSRPDMRNRGLVEVSSQRVTPVHKEVEIDPVVENAPIESASTASAAAAAAALAAEHRAAAGVNIMEQAAAPHPPAAAPAPHAADFPMPSPAVLALLRAGTVIPAHPLAVNLNRELDDRRIRGLTRYYLAAGAGGVAVGVHTTQFDLRKPKFNYLKPVLRMVMSECRAFEKASGQTLVKVAGICGPTHQAVAEAHLAHDTGYDIGLLNLADLPAGATDFELMEHAKQVARVIPIFGFYLQPAVGGRELPHRFWRLFAEIPNVVAIKIAAFDRYRTMDVMRAVAEAGRALGDDRKHPIAIYTGNDDNIVDDLLGDWTFDVHGRQVSHRIVGGLLGHWACWTRAAVDLFESIQKVNRGDTVPLASAMLNRQVTDMNAAVFDAANRFKGCIPGIHEVLRRQGMLDNLICLDAGLHLSPDQAEEITRVIRAYPHLTDDDFVAQHRDEWLR